MRRIQSGIAAAALLLLAAPLAPVAAQAPGIDVRLNPRIGLYEPLSDLAEVQEGGSTIVAEQSGSLALGLGVELDMVLLPVNVRLNLDYATAAEAFVTVDDVEFGDPIETTVLAVVGDVIFRPLPSVLLFSPYLFAGGGLKQYDVADTSVETFQSESDPTLHIGGGIDFGLGPFALNAEVGDYISSYDSGITGADSETQHDLFVTVGFSIGLL